MIDYAKILSKLFKGRRFSIGETYESIVSLDGLSVPPKEELDAAWPQIEYEIEYALVERQRRARYQAETDGMFFAAQRDGGDLSVWNAAVDAIKAELLYPEAL